MKKAPSSKPPFPLAEERVVQRSVDRVSKYARTVTTITMKKLIRSFGYAFKGVAYATATQLNFRIHLFATALALLLGYFLHISADEWKWIMLCVTIVLVTELFNTMIEALVDLVSPGFNEKAGRVKDMAAGTVVIAAAFALIMGLIIFLPKLLLLLS